MPACLPEQFCTSAVAGSPARIGCVARLDVVRVRRRVAQVGIRQVERARTCCTASVWTAAPVVARTHDRHEIVGQRQAEFGHRGRLQGLRAPTADTPGAAGHRPRRRSIRRLRAPPPHHGRATPRIRSALPRRAARRHRRIGSSRPRCWHVRQGRRKRLGPSPSPGSRARRGWCDGGQVAVDDVVALAPFTGQRLHHRGRRVARAPRRRHRAGRLPPRAAPNATAGCSSMVRGGDARREDVVLDLLVHDDERHHDRRLQRRVEERQQRRAGCPARYVPTTGRNWLTRPTHRASATGAGVPMAWKTIQWKNADSSASSARE